MDIMNLFSPEALLCEIQAWASARGLRIKSDLRGNIIAVPLGVRHGH